MSDSPLNAALNRNWIKASAEHERLERENADLRADRDRAFKIGYEITDDCQTVEEMTSALVACIQRVRMNKDKELADLRAKLEEARKDAVPVADILASAAHVAENGAAVARFGGQYEHEGRCRELCAMYLRELVGAFRLKQQFAAIDAAIAQGKEEK